MGNSSVKKLGFLPFSNFESPKGFSASMCDVELFSKAYEFLFEFFNFLIILWEFFRNSLVIIALKNEASVVKSLPYCASCAFREIR